MEIHANKENKNEKLVMFSSGYLSNFYKCSFEVDGIKFTSMEQYFHYKKAQLFEDESSMKKILASNKPAEQKRLGRKVKNYNDEIWSRDCFEIIKKGLYAKFTQNPELKEQLLSIANARFVEARPDKRWGIGLYANHRDSASPSKWAGKNLLGQALDDVRDILKKQHENTSDKPCTCICTCKN